MMAEKTKQKHQPVNFRLSIVIKDAADNTLKKEKNKQIMIMNMLLLIQPH